MLGLSIHATLLWILVVNCLCIVLLPNTQGLLQEFQHMRVQPARQFAVQGLVAIRAKLIIVVLHNQIVILIASIILFALIFIIILIAIILIILIIIILLIVVVILILILAIPIPIFIIAVLALALLILLCLHLLGLRPHAALRLPRQPPFRHALLHGTLLIALTVMPVVSHPLCIIIIIIPLPVLLITTLCFCTLAALLCDLIVKGAVTQGGLEHTWGGDHLQQRLALWLGSGRKAERKVGAVLRIRIHTLHWIAWLVGAHSTHCELGLHFHQDGLALIDLVGDVVLANYEEPIVWRGAASILVALDELGGVIRCAVFAQ
mmetsp:Transcript_14169/g.38377  ORF Transcript_14169/g.38377 Transcript_14169/m.38377 type:complete len:320 (+) Transcript_14169:1229-2188(+)